MLRFFLILAMCGSFFGSARADTFEGRDFILVDGRADKSRPAALVVAMHGFLGTAQSMQQKTTFDAVANRHGFVVVYPSGVRRRWNDGRSARNRTDDVGFLSDLISDLVRRGIADADRVFLAGHSNGGGMAMRMACDRPDLVSGIAVAATKVLTNYSCEDGDPVPAIFFHGTLDPISPDGGRSGGLGDALSSEASLSVWKARNRCTGPVRTQTFDRVDDDTSIRSATYTNCRAKLRHILIEGHGHGWPDPRSRATRLQGPATKEVDAAASSWRFFSQL